MSTLSQVIHSCPSAFIIMNDKGKIVDVNEKTCSLFMYEKGEVIGLAIEKMIPLFMKAEHGELAKEFFDIFTQERLGGGKSLSGIAKNGLEINIEVGIDSFKKDDELYYIVNLIDVTSSARSYRLFERTQEIAHVGSWYYDIKDNCVTWSKTTYSIHEIPIDTKIKVEDGISFYAPEHQAIIRNIIERGISNREPWNTELQIVTGTGKKKWVNAIGNPVIEKGELIALEGTFQDITTQKLQELKSNELTYELEQSNETYALMAEGASVGIWDWVDVNKSEMKWNLKFYELLGHKIDDIEATQENFLSLLHPDDLDKRQNQLENHFRKGVPYDLNYRLKHKSGDYLWFRNTGKVSLDKNGRPKRMVGAIQDIHQRVMSELELKRSNEDLDQFAYIISHDLREPLRGMKNFAGFLLEDYSNQLDEEGVGYLETIRKLGLRLENYLDSLLYFSRLGREKMAYKEVDLNVLIMEIKETYLNPAHTNVVVDVQKNLPHLKCDPLKLGKVIGNLMTNAVRYNESEEKIIKISYEKVDGVMHQFWVKDNGIGMKEEFWDRIFIIFRRLHSKDDYEEGTGLGLTLAKKTVERHGGKMWVEQSVEGVGSTFTFTIEESNKAS